MQIVNNLEYKSVQEWRPGFIFSLLENKVLVGYRTEVTEFFKIKSDQGYFIKCAISK